MRKEYFLFLETYFELSSENKPKTKEKNINILRNFM